MSLAEQNAAQAKKVIEGVGSRIDALAAIADRVKLPTVAMKLREQKTALAEDTFRLPVLGRFRNGKSTFLNALLCETTHPVPDLDGAPGPLPANDLPTTAKLTTINYNRSTSVLVVKLDGRNEDWSLRRYIAESIIRRDPDENERFFKDILGFEMAFPSKTLQSGITILDTPGTDDIRERTEIVEALVNRVDAAIVLLRSDALGGQDERAFIHSLKDSNLNDLFFVVNRRDGRVVDNDLKRETWYRIAELCLRAPRYAGQELSDRNIFFVDAKAALEARVQGNAQKLAASGMDLFELRLSEFLEKNKRAVHVRRFVEGADAHARSIDASICKLIPSLRAKAEEFRAKYQMLQPQLRGIRERKQQLSRSINGYRDRVAMALAVSFQDMINMLCRDLPMELSKQRIPSIDDANPLGRLTLPFFKKKLRAETEAAAKSIYESQLSAWSKNSPDKPGAQRVMNDLLLDMSTQIEEVFKGIKRQFNEIQIELVGLDPSVGELESSDTWAKNVMLGAMAVVWPDYAYNLAAGGGGTLLRGVLVHGATYMVVMWMSGPVTWAIAAGTAVNVFVTAATSPDKLKERFRAQVCEAVIPGLRELPLLATPKIKEEVNKTFDKIESAVLSAAEVVIAKEEDTLREQLETVTKSADEKRTLLSALEGYRCEVKKNREELQNALIAIDPTGDGINRSNL